MAQEESKVLEKTFSLFEPQEAVLANYTSYQGTRFVADETFRGENKPTHARIPVWRKSVKKAEGDSKKEEKKKDDSDKKDEKDKKGGKPGGEKKDKATVWIMDMKGDTIRRYKTEVDTGFTHINWFLDTKGVDYPSNREPDKDQLEPGGGPTVLPGTYKIVVKYGDQLDSVQLRVIDDPRIPEPIADRQARYDALKSFSKTVEHATKGYNRLKEAEKTMNLVEGQWVNVPDSLKKDVLKLGSALRDSISAIKSQFFSQKENQKGIQRNPDELRSYFWKAQGYIDDSKGAPSQSAQIAIKKAEMETDRLVKRIDQLFEVQWKEYRQKAEGVKYSLFKE